MDCQKIGGASNLHMSVAVQAKSAEGSKRAESQESQAAKIAELQKSDAAKTPPVSASPEGVGKMVDLQG